jgi:site-specific DNA recombinase
MIGIYVRVSTEQQSEKYSLEAQRDSGLAFAIARKRGSKVYAEALSGAEFNRPAFQEMLDDIRSGIISIVWVKELSRLSRDISDFQTIKKLFIKHKIMLYVDGAPINLENIDQSFFYNLSSVISAYEKERIRERTIRGRNAAIDKGEYKFPYVTGYRRIYDEQGRNSIAVDEEKADYIREVYRRYLELRSVAILAAIYSKRKSSLLKILRNPIYIGVHLNTEKQLIRFQAYEPIVSEETWFLVQAILDDRYKSVYKKAAPNDQVQ